MAVFLKAVVENLSLGGFFTMGTKYTLLGVNFSCILKNPIKKLSLGIVNTMPAL
jgi:hypothetical protein